MGSPIINTDGSCVIVTCTMCIEAQHRLAYECLYGKGSFPCKVCLKRGIWDSESGSAVGDILDMIIEVGGVLTTRDPNRIKLPFSGFFTWDSPLCLGRDRFARLIYSRGPLVGFLWVVDRDYYRCEGDHVYRGCQVEHSDQESDGYHAVVCIEYKCNSRNK